MKRLSNIYKYMFLAWPAVLYFSYFPVISIGANETMNFEFSLPLIYLMVFDLVAFLLMIKEKKLGCFVKNKLWLLYPVFATVSIVWSLNTTRGILTCGVMWLLLVAGMSMVAFKNTVLKNTWANLKKVIYASAGVAILWCVIQCILDLCGVGREVTLLCEGCTKEMFGFPHPNGFAIEPQFMGNLLIAPALLAGWSLLNAACPPDTLRAALAKSSCSVEQHAFKRDLPLFILFAFGVFLTFSRGAIYAFGVGIVLLIGYWIIKNKNAKSLILAPVVLISFLLALNAQGIMASVSGLGETYESGVAKVLNQLSLGVIDFRAKPEEQSEEASNKVDDIKEPVFDGYVVESTETRVKWTNAAIDIWKKNFNIMLIGVGVGGAGQALYNNEFSSAPKEIVQNEYASVLLETGVIGAMLFVFTISMAFFVVWKKTDAKFVVVIMAAYEITLFFFSGFPNALHIYLLPVMLAATYKISTNKKAP